MVSEMCIVDRANKGNRANYRRRTTTKHGNRQQTNQLCARHATAQRRRVARTQLIGLLAITVLCGSCFLSTSDAADERSSVDLRGSPSHAEKTNGSSVS